MIHVTGYGGKKGKKNNSHNKMRLENIADVRGGCAGLDPRV